MKTIRLYKGKRHIDVTPEVADSWKAGGWKPERVHKSEVRKSRRERRKKK